MVKISLLSLVFGVALFTSACAPTGNTNKSTNTDQVNEFVINNLISNKWCQTNQSGTSTAFLWAFSRNNTVLVNASATQTQEAYFWRINNDNLLTVSTAANGVALFNKKVSYTYDVNTHKRTMRWTEPTAQQTCNEQGVCSIAPSDITFLTECE